jgi:hypothetical protein
LQVVRVITIVKLMMPQDMAVVVVEEQHQQALMDRVAMDLQA